MFTQKLSYKAVSRSICFVLSVVVVTSALALGHIGVQSLADNAQEVFSNMTV